MGSTIPNASASSYFQMKGTTTKLGPDGSPADYKKFVVTKPGEFDFKIENPYTSVQVLDQNNKVVATLKSQSDAADASARLGPGTYTAIVSQQMKDANGRAYALDVSEKQNVMMLSSGASLKGTAHELSGNDTGVQTHTLNVVQGGTFTADFSLPYARWALMSKEGKVVASGDTMSTGTEGTDFLKKQSFKVDPGQYNLIVVPPSNLKTDTSYQLNFIPKTATAPVDTAEVNPIQKTLQERAARLQQWAQEDARKSTSSSSSSGTYKMTVLT